MKRYLFLLSILCFMLSCTGKVYEEGDIPPPPSRNLRVWPMDVAVSDEALSMQYVFVREENLAGVPHQEVPVIYCCGVGVDEGSDKDGELIIQSSKVPRQPRSLEYLILLFEWPHQECDIADVLFTEWESSPLAEGMNLPTTKESNELIREVRKYHEQRKDYYASFLYYAGIKNISISADKPLSGCGAGEDITHLLKLITAPMTSISRFPTFEMIYGFEDEKPTNVTVLNNSLLLCGGGYAVKFAEVPAEKYDEITFTVAMDILLPDGGERTLTGSVKVAFE